MATRLTWAPSLLACVSLALALAGTGTACTGNNGDLDGGTDAGMGSQCTTATAAKDCDDGDPCTVDSCDNGYCVFSRAKKNVKKLATLKATGEDDEVYLYSNHVQVAAGSAGVETWDISKLPTAPTLTTTRPTVGDTIAVNEASDAVVAIEGKNGLEIFPRTGTTTTPIGTFLGADSIMGVGRVDTTLVTYSFGKGLQIVDVSDWTQPTEVARADTPGRAYDAILVDTNIFVADGLIGVSEVDFSTPSAPVLVPDFNIPTEGRVRHIARASRYVTIAEDGAGLGIIDLNAKDGPARIATLPLPGPAMDVDMISRKTAVVADGSAGLVLVDLIDPTKPKVWYAEPTDAPALGLDARGERVAVAQGAKGVAIFDLQCSTAPTK